MTNEELLAAWAQAEERAKGAEARATKAEAAYRFLLMRSAGEKLDQAEAKLKDAEADVEALLDVLISVWCQFALKAPGVEANKMIADGAPAHDGGLSVLEDVAMALEIAGKLESAGVKGKDWWRLKL